ncbi:MAG: DUF4184 family protein [Gammaproteobacteria bacterium]|nr:DUF4184 family protein [Gammaproteobacteria bacterium]
MPFTLTHVIAIVPVKKIPVLSRLSFSALAIGSMVPDAPIFFTFASSYETTHSLTGIVSACLPLGLLFYALFQCAIRTPLLEIMPRSVASKLGERKRHSPGYLAGVALAIVLGAATHLFWDSFTHPAGWGTRMVPALAQLYELFGGRIGGYRLFQHGSSVVCLPLMAFLLWRWARQSDGPVHASVLRLSPLVKLSLSALVFAAPGLYAIAEAWAVTQSVYYGIGFAARNYGTYLAMTTIAGAALIHVWIALARSKLLT